MKNCNLLKEIVNKTEKFGVSVKILNQEIMCVILNYKLIKKKIKSS